MKKESEKIPPAVYDGIGNLKMINGKLKVLFAATQGGRCEYYELSGYQDIARLTLEESIEELNTIIVDIEKCFGMEEAKI